MKTLVRTVLTPAKILIPSIRDKDFLRTNAGFLAVCRNRSQSSDLAFKLTATRGHRVSLRYGKFSGI